MESEPINGFQKLFCTIGAQASLIGASERFEIPEYVNRSNFFQEDELKEAVREKFQLLKKNQVFLSKGESLSNRMLKSLSSKESLRTRNLFIASVVSIDEQEI